MRRSWQIGWCAAALLAIGGQLQAQSTRGPATDALFSEDGRNSAIGCDSSRSRSTAFGRTIRCGYPDNVIDVGGGRLVATLGTLQNEHDGVYWIQQDIVLRTRIGNEPLQVVHTLTQWTQGVHDCETDFVMRRYIVRDLDGDGETDRSSCWRVVGAWMRTATTKSTRLVEGNVWE